MLCIHAAPTYGIWGFPKMTVPFSGDPVTRIIIHFGSVWGPPVYGNPDIFQDVCFRLDSMYLS